MPRVKTQWKQQNTLSVIAQWLPQTFQTPSNFFNDIFKIWIHSNVTCLSINKLNLRWNLIFLSLRSIWLVENNFIFKNILFNPIVTTNTALGKAVKYWSNLEKSPSLNLNLVQIQSHKNTTTLSLWQQPDTSWIKLNCDGSGKLLTRSGGLFQR